jgi:hypothetical protein
MEDVMSSLLARALLKEIPLNDIEALVQILDAGTLKNRDALAEDNGTFCGGGCDAKGGACGAWCVDAEKEWASFDPHGHSSATKDDFNQAIQDPAAFRAALSKELDNAARSLQGGGRPALGPKINAQTFRRG